VCGYSRKHAIKVFEAARRAAGFKEKRAQSDLPGRGASGIEADLVCERSTVRQTAQSDSVAVVSRR